jgi:hypothetical protein
MGALLPSWRQQAVREKEADLIFRGEQYARAIALYYRKNNQTLPTSIDVLVSQRYLRKKYKDPITNEDFLPLGGINPGQAQTGRGGSPSPGQAGPGRGPTVAPQFQSTSGPTFGQAGGGISGVRSTSNETSIRIYRGQQTYSQFPFDYVLALQKMGVVQVNQGGPGGPARGRGGPIRIDENIRVSPTQPGRGPGTGPNMLAPPPPPPPPPQGPGRGR